MDTPPPIAGRYRVEINQPVDGGGGLAAFAVTDLEHGRDTLIAVQMRRGLPARAGTLLALTRPIRHLLHPIAHGPAATPGGGAENFILCLAPPGRSLAAAPHAWSESALLDLVLRPAVGALQALQDTGITHRAIRPDNVFQAVPDQPISLGCAWASPPACFQPALFEPPYVAMCLAAGRGEGSFADDIYALGALLVTLAAGGTPLAGLDDATVIRRKLELGSYAALVGDHRLSPALADLARGMLADDPEHRPSAALLLDPAAARVRRIPSRVGRRAQRRFELGDRLGTSAVAIADARQLAYELAANPPAALAALRDGSVGTWLRRGLGDAGLAARIEEVQHLHDATADAQAGALTLLQVVAVLDPLAPLVWEGISIWPDGIGPALAGAMDTDTTTVGKLERLIAAEAISAWGQVRDGRCDLPLLRAAARQLRAIQRQRGASTASLNHDVARIAYRLNPMLPCASPVLGNRLVLGLADLLAALNASQADPAKTRPVDAHICAFISAHTERRLDQELSAITDTDGDAAGALAQLRLFARLQAMFSPQPKPTLSKWLAARSPALADVWHRRDRRARADSRLRVLAEAGLIAPMLAMIEDPAARAADLNEARQAVAAVRRIDTDLSRLRNGAAERSVFAHHLGQEIAAGLGLTLLVAVLTVKAMG